MWQNGEAWKNHYIKDVYVPMVADEKNFALIRDFPAQFLVGMSLPMAAKP